MCALSDGSVFGARYPAFGRGGMGEGRWDLPLSFVQAGGREPKAGPRIRCPVPGTGYLEECRAHASKNVYTGWA
jgi:hypothetical protein